LASKPLPQQPQSYPKLNGRIANTQCFATPPLPGSVFHEIMLLTILDIGRQKT